MINLLIALINRTYEEYYDACNGMLMLEKYNIMKIYEESFEAADHSRTSFAIIKQETVYLDQPPYSKSEPPPPPIVMGFDKKPSTCAVGPDPNYTNTGDQVSTADICGSRSFT